MQILANRCHQYLLIILLMMLSPNLFAKTVIWQDSLSEIPVNTGVHYVNDHSNDITLKQISSSEYINNFKVHNSSDDLALKDSPAIWTHFGLINESEKSPYLILDSIHFVEEKNLRVFLLNSQKETVKQLRKIKDYPFPVYKLNLQKGERVWFYIQVKTPSLYKPQIPIRIISAETLYAKGMNHHAFFASLLAGFLILLVYNLILFLTLKEKNYLLLVSFLVCAILLMQRPTGLIPYLALLRDQSFYFFSLPFSIFLASTIAFWKRIIGLQYSSPKANRFFNGMIIFNIISIPFLGLMTWTFENIFYLESLLLLLAMPWYTVKRWLAGDRIARLFMISVIIILTTISPVIFAALGLIEVNSNIHKLYLLGSLLFALSLSLMQAFYVGELRIEKERVETLNKTKDMFLATTSHELRTPMHAIQSGITLLRQTLLTDKQKRYLEKMDTSSKHMLRLVEDILMQSRSGQDQNILQLAPFSLDQFLNTLRALLAEAAQQKNLHLIINNEADLKDKHLLGDEIRLKQVLSNLLSNAIKFTSTGKIGLYIKAQKITENQVYLYFEVHDTGIGFSEAQKRNLFKPFYQAEQGDNRRYTGSGLGLAISQQLVNLMGGKIECKCEENKGSRFFFTLDFELQNPSINVHSNSVKIANTESLVDHDDCHILMVEDDELNQFFAREIFQQIGLRLTVVDRGQKALNILKQKPFDLILMDISMPEMDGYETTRRIRKQEAFAHIPIIALSAHAADSDKARCLQVGMNDHLSKPFELAQLKAVLIRHLALTKKT